MLINSSINTIDKIDTSFRVLIPMLKKLNTKNIFEGIHITQNDNKIYLCFEKEFLSITNIKILTTITQVYSDICFHTDELDYPEKDRLIWWEPNQKNLNDPVNTSKRCLQKKGIVFEMEKENLVLNMGMTLMIADVLQEQTPIHLEKYQDEKIFDEEIIKRHLHYLNNHCPDQQKILLSVYLNKENPLNDNSYAPLFSLCNLNTDMMDHNIVEAIFLNREEKKYLNFLLNPENVKEAIIDYIQLYYIEDIPEEILNTFVEKKMIKVLKNKQN